MDYKGYRPLADMILVRPAKPVERRTEGGIIIPGTTVKVGNVGVALAVGPGRPPHGSVTPMPMAVKVGDELVYDDQALTTVEIGDELLHVVPEGLVLLAKPPRPAGYNAMHDPEQYRPRR